MRPFLTSEGEISSLKKERNNNGFDEYLWW